MKGKGVVLRFPDGLSVLSGDPLEFWFEGKGCPSPRRVNIKKVLRNRRRRKIAKASKKRNRGNP